MQGKILAAALAAVLLSGVAHAQIKMGVGGPITGSDAAFGAQLKNGVEQAVSDINSGGGIMGQKIELSIGDDAGDAKQGRSVANQFIGEGVTYVVGHFNSSVTMPASEAYNEAGILEITPASTNPQITERGLPMLFRTCGLDDQTRKALAAAGVHEVLYEGLNKGEKDYSAIVSKIKSVDADIVFFGGL